MLYNYDRVPQVQLLLGRQQHGLLHVSIMFVLYTPDLCEILV